MLAVDHDFPLIGEIDRHATGAVALDLAGAPFGVLGVTHAHARRENGV